MIRRSISLAPFVAITVLGACASNKSNATAPASSSSAPNVVASASASSTPSVAPSSSGSTAIANRPIFPADLATIDPEGTFQEGPFAWPIDGSSAIVHERGHSSLVWKSPVGTGVVTFPRESAHAIVHDANGDGAPELVVFAEKPSAADYDQSAMWIVGIAPATQQPARMPRLETALLGALNEASLDRERASLTTFGNPNEMPPERVVVRLPLATAAEMQELVGPKGLKLCARLANKRDCFSVSQKSIQQKHATEIAAHGGTFAEFTSSDSSQSDDLNPPSCAPEESHPDRIRCSANIGGPMGGEWIFEKSTVKTGQKSITKVRLAEVWNWAEDS